MLKNHLFYKIAPNGDIEYYEVVDPNTIRQNILSERAARQKFFDIMCWIFSGTVMLTLMVIIILCAAG